MAQIRTTCPRCNTPAMADVQQLVDVSTDPSLKQRLLNGSLNVMSCPNCGYQGMLSTPIVYHDPEKELLLTYFPPELGLPVNEQEKQVGPMITQVTNRLPPEKRKAYLLRPQSMFTFQTLVERILESEGITKEMIEDQQKRLRLLQRLLSTPEAETRAEIIKQEEDLIDESFFGLISRLAEAGMMQGDEGMTRALSAVHSEALALTKVGQQLKSQADEAQEAVRSLQEATKTEGGLTREKLVDLVIAAPTETRVNTLVSLTRNGVDYKFFQLLSERIDKAEGAEKDRLLALRQQITEITARIDKQLQAQLDQGRKLLNTILSAKNMEEAIAEHAQEIDEFFVEALNNELEIARKDANLERIAKLNQINQILEKASAPPPEIALMEEMLQAADDDARRKILEANSEMITPEFIQLMAGLISQSEQQGQPPELLDQLQQAYRVALRYSMEQSMKK